MAKLEAGGRNEESSERKSRNEEIGERKGERHVCDQECGCGTWKPGRRILRHPVHQPTGKPNLDIIEKNWEEYS